MIKSENNQRLILYKIFIHLLHDLGMLKTCKRLRKAYAYACNYNRDYKRVAQNMHISLGFNDKRDADWIVSVMVGERDALQSDLFKRCKFFEEEGGENYCSDNAESSSHEEDETPQKSDGVAPRKRYDLKKDCCQFPGTSSVS